MSFESFLERITTPSSPDDVLVCEAKFDGLRAIVIDKKGEKLTLGHEVGSTHFNLEEAVEDIVKKAREYGWNGQYAILVNPAVSMSILELSIPPNNKLPIQQIAETIQWEFEPAYNQHKNILTVGQLLQILGYLNEEQVNEVLQRQNELINSKNSTVVYKRFGELAMESGFLSQKHLNNALTRQQWFVSEGDTLKCGWLALSRQPLAEVVDYKWLVVGIKQDLLRAWQAAFSKYEVKLEAMYPVAGGGEQQDSNANGKTGQTIRDDREILIEVHRSMMAGIVFAGEELQQIQTVPCTDETMLANVNELISALGQEDDVPVRLLDCVSNSNEQSKQLEADIRTVTDRSVTCDFPSMGKISLPMRIAVRHFLRARHAGYVEGVSVHEPLPPVMQRFPVRAVLAGLLVLGLVAFSELSVFAGKLWINTSIASISEDVNRIRSEKNRINTKISNVNKLKSDIENKEKEKKNAITMISLLTKELPERNQALSQLMMRLQETTTEDIVINSIIEDTLFGFTFDAWALSDQAAQSFVKNFQLAIHPMDYRIKNLTVKEQTGRLGLIGYSLRFSITQLSETEWTARKKRMSQRGY